MNEATHNLVLVFDIRLMDQADFIEIARRIRVRAPDIQVLIVDNRYRRRATARQAVKCPSLVMCPFPLVNFEPLGGKIYQGQSMGKIGQLERLDEAGIPTPKWTVVDGDTNLDPAEWGPAVVVKPEFGWSGQSIRMLPTNQVSQYVKSMRQSGEHRENERWLAQLFIDTGDPFSFYRVFLLFSKTLNCHVDTAPAPAEVANLGSIPISGTIIAVNNMSDRTSRHAYDLDILEFASQVHDGFPDRPVLGIDIVREINSGRLYALETNPSGYVWHLSSAVGRKFQQEHGYNDYEQFDALSVAADVLVERTRAEAS